MALIRLYFNHSCFLMSTAQQRTKMVGESWDVLQSECLLTNTLTVSCLKIQGIPAPLFRRSCSTTTVQYIYSSSKCCILPKYRIFFFILSFLTKSKNYLNNLKKVFNKKVSKLAKIVIETDRYWLFSIKSLCRINQSAPFRHFMDY